ncbi:ketopantoate reductase family protein [Gordonia otitidis]|uniref:2-dehydropantoate 2-reductase n=1 Tax=Gordonia otitidis (strain DSM 44809 / CCUG 52243 / JCM 12355 / NBRC 100426 / IFM 10032) TaxID=1108044 RepID=H5TN07_GORO1|nr:2-dehydropantoate 2-reductase [Gordonia otitidis]GAB34865.1 2-dehydropantoate 2-reductase [Gordonia otitidis NBRC 100426]
MRFVIYGAGAIGGVIGAHLALSGADTTLVARGEHLRAMREHGLVLDTADGRQSVSTALASNASEVGWDDDTVVLLAVKSQQTAAAIDDLRAHMPVKTPVVSAQNGVANERELPRVFPHVYSLCVMLPALHLEPGVVVQASSNRPGILDVGRYPSGTDEVAQSISSALRTATFLSEPRSDIMAWKYRKLIMNLVNGIDASFRDDGQAFSELVRRARAEGEQVITAAGIDIVSEATDKQRRGDAIVRRDTGEDSLGSSTWQSVARGSGSVETDYLSGEIVLLGRLHGVPTPVNALVQSETNRLVREGLPAASSDAQIALSGLASR